MEKLDANGEPAHVANPVVYKLVRVDGNGKIIPATEDEVMEAENMFEQEKVEAPSIIDVGQIEESVPNDISSAVETKAEYLEGRSHSAETKVAAEKLNARLEYIGVMLQKVKQEERLRLSSASSSHSSNVMIVDGQCSDQHDRLSAVEEKLQVDLSLKKHPLPLKDNCKNEVVNAETHLKSADGLTGGGSSASSSSSMPDFSRIKGEICLDNLTIRELQETFRATFGRETAVRDKLWLKRRIAMGLTNSCDVETTTFTIRGNVLVGRKLNEAHSGVENSKNATQIGDLSNHSCKELPTSPTVRIGHGPVASSKRFRRPQAEYDWKSEDILSEQSAAKRIRKPTKRYIEEISDAETRECGGKAVSSTRYSGNDQSPPKSVAVPICDVKTGAATLITRHDSLGGSGVQVPYVSRVRRGRPRENFMSIMQYHPTSMGKEVGLVKNALGARISQPDIKSEEKIWNDKGVSKHIQQQVVLKAEQEKENSVKCFDEKELKQEQAVPVETVDIYGDDSYFNASLPISKDGIKRKHHRPWTLSEVVKLVEGVSKYGAGRWSEIKKVSFASHHYRTSVDLKDKWRNLLRASFAHGSSDRMNGYPKKHGAIPLPPSVLLRVRQLAEKHSQGVAVAVPSLSSMKFPVTSVRSVHEKRSGYL